MKNCIASIRKAKGLTLQSLADRVGASNQQISHLEKGRRGLTTDWLERIAAGLECHSIDLLESDPSLMLIGGAAPTIIEQQLALNFRKFTVVQQEAMLAFLRTVVGTTDAVE